MKTVLSLVLLISSSMTLAAGPCENKAKYGAIRAYKAEVGTIQGSNGVETKADLVQERNGAYSYIVSVMDNNEDGEYWTLDYAVVVKGQDCKIVSVRKI
jgi:hypothetical protein